MLDATTTNLLPTEPTLGSLADRDEYGPITGRPGGLFTAATIPSLLGDCVDLGRRLADWVPEDYLL
jgi:hypothetical protein